VERRKKRGSHRKRRPRRPFQECYCTSMGASTAGSATSGIYELIVIMDDAYQRNLLRTVGGCGIDTQRDWWHSGK